MYAKTCEEYVLTQLQDSLDAVDNLEASLVRANDTIDRLEKRIEKLREVFMSNGYTYKNLEDGKGMYLSFNCLMDKYDHEAMSFLVSYLGLTRTDMDEDEEVEEDE